MTEKKEEIRVKFDNITSEIDEDSYLSFNCEVIFENLYDDEFICEYQLSFYKKSEHIHFGTLEKCIINSNQNNIYCYASLNIDGAYIPNACFWLGRNPFDLAVGLFRHRSFGPRRALP